MEITKTEAIEKIIKIALEANLDIEVFSIGNPDRKITEDTLDEDIEASEIDWITISK